MRLLILLCTLPAALVLGGDDAPRWDVHDMNRPRPEVIQTPASGPPSDAIVLFDGTDLSAWVGGGGKPARWKVENGYMKVNKTGSIRTAEKFGSCQIHLEWRTPSEIKGQGQGRGNSGVFLMDRYEVQILDSHENPTYADGQAASLYGQQPPLVNACRGPGEWQSYDIIFHRPRFNEDGSVERPATVTVIQNGVLVQDHVEFQGATAHKRRASYQAHADALPIGLQDHGNPMRFRNIWVRPLKD